MHAMNMSGSGPRDRERGLALISVMMVTALLAVLLGGYFGLTMIEQVTTKSTMNSFRGFYAAEAGLNVRAELVRQKFVGYAQPAGTAPSTSSTACTGSNMGGGDFKCLFYNFHDREVPTYVKQTAGPSTIRIPRGETYQNLNAAENKFVVYSQALGKGDIHEAVLEMHFKSRLVNLFQFAAFYDKDLELINGPDRVLEGPIHSNGDIYLGSTGELDLVEQITASGDIYRGPKDSDTCLTGDISATDPDDPLDLPACSSTRRKYTAAELHPWNDMVQNGVDQLTVPSRTMLEPTDTRVYWNRADVRILLDVTSSNIEAYRPDGTKDGDHTAALTACGSTSASATFYNNREAATIQMLDVDVQDLLDCIHTMSQFSALPLNDTTDGGLVIYVGVTGPDETTLNNYGVRLYNGEFLGSTDVSAPDINGLTFASEQAVYIQGNYNEDGVTSTVDQRPAAVLADSINLLSNNWPGDAASTAALSARVASDTYVVAAFLSGTDTTGGAEGTAGQDAGGYAGGLENFFRLHEDWSGATLVFRGSLVSLEPPRHVDGAFAVGGMFFQPPTLDWNFDWNLNDPTLQPPLSPRFVYLRQELFVRQFEL